MLCPRFVYWLILFLCLLTLSTKAHTEGNLYSRREIPAVQTKTPPVIDGLLEDAAWKTAPRAEKFFDPKRDEPVADQTVAYLLYDNLYIYVAFDCKDSEPEKIVARETIRDSYFGAGSGDDSVQVIFDPFLSYRWDDFAVFVVNPLGTRSSRITGGHATKVEWKGDWGAAARRTPEGWTAEMRIPWAILQYPANGKPITIGINFWRYQARTKLSSVWSNVGPLQHNELAGLWRGVVVPSGAFKPTLSALPYLLTGLEQDRPSLHTGVDMRFPLSPSITMVGSVNPDFATIEGAVEGIQFSRSERFVPERRPFFLEGWDYFDVGGWSSFGRLFYSNRIGTFDTGIKIFGKPTAEDSIGVLGTLDAGRRRDFVGRYERQLSPASSVGIFLSQRSAADDNNTVGVLTQDARWGKVGLSSQWGISSGQDSGGAAKLVSLRFNDKHLFASLRYQDVAPHFRDANGLIPFTDYRGFRGSAHWYADWQKGFWRRFSASIYPEYDWHTNGKPFRRGAGCNLSLTTWSDWSISADMQYQRFDAQTDRTYGLAIRQGVSNRFRQWGISLSTGKVADRPYTYLGPEFNIRLFHKMDIGYSGAIQNLNGTTQQHILTATYEISPSRSVGGRIVVQNADTNWYLSFRDSGEKGIEMFFIFGDPNASRFVERAALKFVFAM
jgi:hypothetical protein